MLCTTKLDNLSRICYNTCTKCVEEDMSSSYDLLKDTWIYRDIQHEVVEEFQQQQLDAHRQTLLAIVQARFPRIEALAQQVAQRISKPERLQELVVRVGMARTEREARQGMNEQGDGYSS